MIVLVLPDIPQEDQLLAQAKQGDQDAIMRIYDQYFPAIFSFIRLRVDDPHVAEDLASEVFLRLVAAIQNRTAPRQSLRGWLFRVARNLLYDHYGQVKRFPTTTLDDWLPDDANLESQIAQSMDRDHARRAIRMLADDQQEVLLLRFGQGLSLQETADIMGRNVGAVKSLQFRAVSTLRQVLGQA